MLISEIESLIVENLFEVYY